MTTPFTQTRSTNPSRISPGAGWLRHCHTRRHRLGLAQAMTDRDLVNMTRGRATSVWYGKLETPTLSMSHGKRTTVKSSVVFGTVVVFGYILSFFFQPLWLHGRRRYKLAAPAAAPHVLDI